MKINPLRLDTSDKDFEQKILKRIRINNSINKKVQNEVDVDVLFVLNDYMQILY